MNLNKHDAETDMEMNMTPMIDVVFLLIIFFMIITDLTQQDLEDLVLPVAQSATSDKVDPDVVRPVLNILASGQIIVKRESLYDPEQLDDMTPVERYLSTQARQMPKLPLAPEKPVSTTNPLIPDNPLLIRADENTPFNYIQRIMQICGKQGIQIWKLQLAASEPEEEEGA